MNQFYQQPNTDTPNREQEKKRKGVLFLFLLFIIMLITSCIAGFILGRGSRFPDYSGKAIDTVQVTQPEAQKSIHLAGKIFYSDGTPYAYGTIQLHSEPKTTLTDEKGAFIFQDAQEGDHTISILDGSGAVLARRTLHISRRAAQEDAKVNLLDEDEYEIEVAVNIKYLEIQVEINKEDGQLYINPDKVTYMTDDGIVTTPAGKADISKGVVVTPAGNVITTDGTIICGSGENDNRKVIIPSGSLEHREDGSIAAPDGTTVKPDGTVIYKNTVIDTNGVSFGPQGKKEEPGDGGYQIVEDEQGIDQIPIGKETEKLIGTSGPESGDSPAGTVEKGDNQGNSGVPGANNSGTGSSDTNTPGINTPGTGGSGTDSPGTDIPQNPEDHGVGIEHGTSASGLVSWQQNTAIDLFYNRTAGIEDKKLIAPGSEGYYVFRLSNDNSFSVACSLSVSEKDMYLPLEFAIADDRGKLLTPWTATEGKAEAATGRITLGKREKQIYQIKWRWPYEAGKAQDMQDTEAGELDERTYTVDLKIMAEQQ